jgi:hypothetical protein
VQVGNAQFLQIGDFVGHLVQGAGEAVGVADVADHAGLLEPVGFGAAFEVEQAQFGRPVAVAAGHNVEKLAQMVVEVVEMAVEVG